MVRPLTLAALALALSTAGIAVKPAMGAVGDQIAQVTPDIGNPVDFFCSIGVAFDGTSLYVDKCGDPNIFEISPADGSLISTFNTGVGALPNALAFDTKRNGIWFGAQGCDGTGMPIHFWDFDDNSVTLMFTIPFALINPATGNPFLPICFDDGLAYNENDPTTDADDELWFSDDVVQEVGVFSPAGALLRGFDATTVDPSLQSFSNGNSGLAIGGTNLYMGNDGGGDVFRAVENTGTNQLDLVDQFVSGDDRQEDMECDPVTFAPTEVMWVRTTPQGGAFPNVVTGYEIEPNSCGLGGGGGNTPPVASCTESVNPSGKTVPPAGSTTLPGPKGGQNEDGFYELIGEDAEDGTAAVFVTNASGSATFGPFSSGSVVKITEAPGAAPTSKPMGGPDSAVAAHITLDSDAFVFAVDGAGEESPVVSCLVPPPPK